MNKTEFLNLLTEKLSALPKNEIKKSVDYYNEMISDRIEDGLSEEEAVAAIGDIDETVKNIMCDMSMPALMSAKLKESHSNSSNKVLWTILLVVGSPVWLPLLFAFAAVILAFYFVIWSLIISLYAVILAFAVATVGSFFGGIAMSIAIPSVSAAVFFIGFAVVCLAITLFMINPVIYITKQLVKFTALCLRKIKASFFSTKGVAK